VVRVRPLVSDGLARRGFYERKRAGLGRQYDEQAFDSLRVFTVNQLFRRIPPHDCSDVDFGLAPPGTPLGFSATGAPTGATGIRGAGARKVFVNGLPVRNLVDWFPKGGEIDVEQLEGVEVYNGPEVPGSFAGLDTDCGAILLWLR
jgi:hypothetical protein